MGGKDRLEHMMRETHVSEMQEENGEDSKDEGEGGREDESNEAKNEGGRTI